MEEKFVKKKRKMLLIIAILISLMLTSCDYEYSLYHTYIRDNTNVVSIEMINYDDPNSINDFPDNTLFNSEKLTVLEILNSNDQINFLDELSAIGGLSSKLKQTISSPNGKGLLVSYGDGGFSLITVTNINEVDCIYVGLYDSDNNVESFYGISWPEMIADFKSLILKYFEIDIDQTNYLIKPII